MGIQLYLTYGYTIVLTYGYTIVFNIWVYTCI